MRAFTIFIAVYLMGGCLAYGRSFGPGSGGGGGVVLCLNPDQSVKSIELVDLVESKFYDHTVPSASLAELSWEQQVKAAMNRIAFVDPEFNSLLISHVNYVHQHLAESFADTAGTQLIFPAPQDLSRGRVPPINLGCQVAGAAVYSDSADNEEGKLTLSSFIWNQLSETNKAALIMHESIYATHRKIYLNLQRETAPDSAATRALVGYLFSTELEQNSPTATERERFAAKGAFRSFDLSAQSPFALKMLGFMQPILPYFLKGAERPVFLDSLACDGGFNVEVTDAEAFKREPGHSCTAKAVAHLYPARIDVRVFPLASRDAVERRMTYKYEYHQEGLLEDLRLECKSKDTLKRFNPGFQLYCGKALVANVGGTTDADLVSLPMKKKSDFNESFLKDFDFAN